MPRRSPCTNKVDQLHDIGSKIMAFSQLVPYTICILSANGVICNVTLRQPSTYGGTITFEGQFEILSLSGTFSHMDNGGSRSRTGGMSVSLAGSDGRVLGGGVSGGLIAAAPVQVVIGSFIPEEKKLKPQLWKREPLSVPPHMMSFGSPVITVGTPITTVSPPSQDTLSESSDEDCSGGNSGPSNNNIQFSQGAALPYNRWVNSHSMNLHIHGHMTN
ncbi:hypothetical protein GIB67_038698 [Kingdonia uniflora]|uniref:AT-hook motif nuclear-localized protein n=1 Tax=Kingdonia uniflora TaxID=39325 RepID=A0A7J7NSI1_9MAGN|nr:hypothetical protein GIB67_038698 [Kingdonia uniflora]